MIQPSGNLPSTTSNENQSLEIHSGEHVNLLVHLEEGSSLDLQIVQASEFGEETRTLRVKNLHRDSGKKSLAAFFYRIKNSLTRHWQVSLIALVLAVYLISRLVSLPAFPIYFFTDEAIQTNRAAELIMNHWKGEGHEILPTYFINGGQYNLGVSVYVQVLPYLIFGKSIWVTRGVSVLISLLAILAVGLAMWKVFGSKYPFLGMLVLSITPAWFLHSRTAFETVLAVSFYAGFLYCYLRYRKGDVNYLFAAAVFAALSFYSYSPAQLVITVTLLGLFFMDIPYHWKNRARMYPLIGITILALFPYIRFVINHPNENLHHLQILDSYLATSMPLPQKILAYLGNYASMINPLYWFSPQTSEIVRHVMKGYGFLLWWTFPLAALGFVLTCMRLKKPEYRILLMAFLAAPTGAALVAPSITRALFMVIPAALLTAIGIDQLIEWLSKIKVKKVLSVAAIGITLIGVNGYMLYDVLVNAPTWFDDYGLYGMQYGARQVFNTVKDYVARDRDAKLIVATSWTNGADIVARFFFDDPLPFKMDSIEGWLDQIKDLDDHMIFVIPPDEFAEVEGNPKFKTVDIVKTINYPNGKPGFYFVKLAYADNITQQLEDEANARHQLIPDTAVLADGTKIDVQYSKLDMGKIQDAFDGNEKTLIRTAEANPLVVKITFKNPYPVSQITLLVGGAPTTADIEVLTTGSSTPVKLEKILPDNIEDRHVTFNLDSQEMVTEITLSIKNTNNKEPDHVHLWEIALK